MRMLKARFKSRILVIFFLVAPVTVVLRLHIFVTFMSSEVIVLFLNLNGFILYVSGEERQY